MNLKKFYDKKILVREISALVILAILFPEFIANDKPVICKIDSKIQSPVFQDFKTNLRNIKDLRQDYNWESNVDWALWPIIKHSPHTIHVEYCQLNYPFQPNKHHNSKHYLGTDELGRDILARLIYGGRISLILGLCASTLALIIGVFLGGIAGFYGDYDLKLSIPGIILFFLSILLSSYLLWNLVITHNYLNIIFILICLLLLYFMNRFLGKWFTKKISIPCDSIIMRTIDIFKSVPVIIALIALSILFKFSLILMIMIISIFTWPLFATLFRNQLFSLKESNYFKASKVLGFNDFKIISKELLPNAITPLLVNFTFAIPVAILFEGNLSFLGIGLDPAIPSWGNMLSEAKNNFTSWWITLFPGLMLFGTILTFRLLGKKLVR